MFYFLRFNSTVLIFNNFHFLEVWDPHSEPSASFPAPLKRTFLLFWAACLQPNRGGNKRIVLAWVDPQPNPSAVQVCPCSRCSFVQLHGHPLFVAKTEFWKDSLPNTILFDLRGGNGWKSLELYKCGGKQCLWFTGFWCFTVEVIWWKANCRNSLGSKVPHWLLEECRAGKCRILSGCQFGC